VPGSHRTPDSPWHWRSHCTRTPDTWSPSSRFTPMQLTCRS